MIKWYSSTYIDLAILIYVFNQLKKVYTVVDPWYTIIYKYQIFVDFSLASVALKKHSFLIKKKDIKRFENGDGTIVIRNVNASTGEVCG